MTTFTQVSSNPTFTYWDQSGNYYTILGGTIERKQGTSSSSLTTSGSITAASNGGVVSTNKITGSVTISVPEGTYVTAQYRGATEGAIGWWRAASFTFSFGYVPDIYYKYSNSKSGTIIFTMNYSPSSALYNMRTMSFTFTGSSTEYLNTSFNVQSFPKIYMTYTASSPGRFEGTGINTTRDFYITASYGGKSVTSDAKNATILS